MPLKRLAIMETYRDDCGGGVSNTGLCRGHIQQIGAAEEIQNSPATPFVASFVDDVNRLPATCQVQSWLVSA